MGTEGVASPWGKRFYEMLKEGPVDKEIAFATLTGMVPPGQAWRTYERTRRGVARRRGQPEPELTPNEDGVRSGSRQIVMAMLNTAVQRGRVRREEDAWGRVTYHFVRDVLPPMRGAEASKRALKGVETLRREKGDAFLSERSQKGANSRRLEERRESGKKGWLNKSPEERAAIIKKGLAAYPPERRAANIKAGWAKRSDEEKTEISKARWAKIGEEERQRRALKGAETRRRRAWFRKGSERTNESVSQGPEERVEQDQHRGEGGAARDHEGAMG